MLIPESPTHPAILAAVVHAVLALGVSLRVIMRRPKSEVALAWLFLVGALPWIGAVGYFMFGERRISRKRASRIEHRRRGFDLLVEKAVERGLPEIAWGERSLRARSMNRLGVASGAFPTVSGSADTLYSDTEQILGEIVKDIEGARSSVLMEFYIWNEGGLADEVLEALVRAAGRGVSCRVLVDALGGRPWWRGKQPRILQEGGVQVKQALPTGPFRTLIDRTDLRLHRKIVLIDGRVAWTGSMNMVDPEYFKQDIKVGRWVDAMFRGEGLMVAPLALTLISDWALESGERIEDLIASIGITRLEPEGEADVQVVPSGPGTGDALLQMLLATVNAARETLTLTTPYFVPDDSLLRALRGAAGRGVRVEMILPEKVDSLLTRHASRSYYDDLLENGVHIYLYRKGLLHTKSITADRHISMFGTVNLDMRSIWINYEVSLFVYGSRFGEDLHDLQQEYLRESELLDSVQWSQRPTRQRFLENTCRLVSPIL